MDVLKFKEELIKRLEILLMSNKNHITELNTDDENHPWKIYLEGKVSAYKMAINSIKNHPIQTENQ